ncbi:MAG: sel1 repeat family protein [Opitutae bacterium]|nr:sel1 repeat family protein [Opitutae bacterium]
MFAILCFDTFKDMEPSPANKNAGGFLLLTFGWFSQWKDIWGLVARRRGLAWAAAVTYGATMLGAGFVFFVWWPRDWAAWWVIIPTVLATALVMSGDGPVKAKTGPETDSPARPGGTPAETEERRAEATPAPRSSPVDPPPLPALPPKTRRRWPVAAGGALLLIVLLGGAASYLFGGSGGTRLREQWRAYLGAGDAQLVLAWRYREGDGPRQNFEKAAYWLGRASRNGVMRAHYDLAVLEYYGLGVTSDVGDARQHLQAAADHDYAPALTMLGLMAQNDDGDAARAMEFWQRAATLHDGWGEHLLGSAYLQRRGEGEENIINALVHLERGRRLGVEPIQGMIEHVWATLDEADFERVADEVYRQLEGEPAAT